MSNGLYIFVTILVLILITLILTFIHELGHFSVAKWFKVRISEFSIGFGPAMFQWKKGNTTFSIRWIPLGGYVSPLTDEVVRNIEKIRKANPNNEEKSKIESKLYSFTINEDYKNQNSLNKVPYFGKVLFILAGVFMNFMFGWLVNFISYQTIGRKETSNNPFLMLETQKLIQGEVQNNVTSVYPIEYVFALNNSSNCLIQNPSKIIGFEEIDKVFQNPGNNNLSICIKLEKPYDFLGGSDQSIYSSPIEARYYVEDNVDLGDGTIVPIKNSWLVSFADLNTTSQTYKNYILPKEAVHRNFYFNVMNSSQAFVNSAADSFKIFGGSFVLIGDILTLGLVIEDPPQNEFYLNTVNPSDASASREDQTSKLYLANYIQMLSVFSILLVSFNIVPIPPLDGYKFFEFTYERISGKRISDKMSLVISRVGWVFVAYTVFASIFILF